MANDLRPGELGQVGAADAVTEDPPVRPVGVEPPEVPVADPVLGLIRVAVLRPLVGELPHVVVQGSEDLLGHHPLVVGRPSPHDRDHPGEDCFGVRAAQAAHLDGQPTTNPLDGGLTGFDQQFPVVAADIEPQEIESLLQRHDSRLILIEGQTCPFRRPADLRRVGLI